MPEETLLIVGDTERNADMLYAVGMFVPDPFIFLRVRGKSIVVMSDLEIDRARKHAQHCEILSLSYYRQKLNQRGHQKVKLADVICVILKEKGINQVVVPASFPFATAKQLLEHDVQVVPREGAFFSEREIKSSSEVKKISAAQMMAEVGLAEGIQALKKAKIGQGNRLFYRNLPLTAEKLRAIIDTAVLQAGGIAKDTIVACGKKGCDPHERGYGPLRAHQPIILDIFPRSQKTGYYGDITRTVVRGRAGETVHKIYDHVHQAQELAIQRLVPESPAADIHKEIQTFFNDQGFETGSRHGRMEGFFHGTGHGVGLELHEHPRLGETSESTLKVGQVVTVEPGLYYGQVGGVRLEDVVLIGKKQPQNLTQFEKVLEI